MAAVYDVFVSHAWADGDLPQRIAERLTKAGLRVWFDAHEITDFAGITRAVSEGLAQSKALLAYYSKTYPLRRACQWELSAAFLAAQCEGDPRRRILVINPEPNASHIHPVELRDAKFLSAPTGDGSALDAVVKSIAKHVASLNGPLADIHPLTTPNWYGMTPVGSTRFVGRIAEMWQVHSLLHRGDVTQITGASVATGGIGQVSGLGGVGKSLLAEEYALRFGAAYPGGIFWLRAYGNDDSKSALTPEAREAERVGQFQSVAERLGVSTQGLSVAQIEGALAREIERRGDACLWVLDDVPNGLDGEALRWWFAPHPLARTLITTRSREYGSLALSIDLSVLTPEEAYQLVTSRKQPVTEAEKEQARLLAFDLGYHALALDVTASALASSVAAEIFADFRAKLAKPDKDAMALAETLSDALPNGHEKSIAQTILRSVRGLGVEGKDVLRLASVLAVAPIPASLVTAVFQRADNLSRSDAEERASLAFKQVISASLAEPAGEQQDARAVHTMVSRAVRFQEKRRPERTEALRVATISALIASIARVAKDPRLHHQIEFDVVHARQVVSISTADTTDEADLFAWVAVYDLTRGAYTSAQILLEGVFDLRSRVLGPEHQYTLISKNNLAETLFRQGHFAGARKLQEEALGILRQMMGAEHRDTLASMNNLARTLSAQGDLAGAYKLQKETLEILCRVLGAEHPITLTSMNNLASTLFRRGDFDEACKLQQRTFEIRRRMLGPEHPDTLGSMDNLALTLFAQGDSVGARKLQDVTLEISRRILGPEHPDTLTSMNNLASTLFAQGDLAGARKLQEMTLEIDRRVQGPEHPDTLTSMNNLASVLIEIGELAGAHKLQEETLEVRRRVLGLEHPDTSSSAWNLFQTLHGLEEHAAAHAILKRDLLWLLDRDSATLGADQRTLREYVAEMVEENDD